MYNMLILRIFLDEQALQIADDEDVQVPVPATESRESLVKSKLTTVEHNIWSCFSTLLSTNCLKMEEGKQRHHLIKLN